MEVHTRIAGLTQIHGSIWIMNRGEDPTAYQSTHRKTTTIDTNGGGGGTVIGWSVEPSGDVGLLGETYIFSTLR